MNRLLVLALASLFACAVLSVFCVPTAQADEPAMGAAAMDGSEGGGMDVKGETKWKDHPGAAVAAGFGIAILGFLGFVGLGCAVGVLASVFPGIAAASDRHARMPGGGWPFVVGTLVLLGAILLVGGAAAAGGHVVGAVLALLIGVPLFLLLLLGWVGALPLLGERLLGSRGPDRSLILKAVTATVALGIGSLPGVLAHHVFAPISVFVAFAAFGWPLGVGLSTVLRRGTTAPTASDATPPGPVPT